MSSDPVSFNLDHAEIFAVARIHDLTQAHQKDLADVRKAAEELQKATADVLSSIRIRHNLPENANVNVADLKTGAATWTTPVGSVDPEAP